MKTEVSRLVLRKLAANLQLLIVVQQTHKPPLVTSCSGLLPYSSLPVHELVARTLFLAANSANL